MKIAVSSTGPTLDNTVEARFGRCSYFLLVNPATLEFEAIANASLELIGGRRVSGLGSGRYPGGRSQYAARCS